MRAQLDAVRGELDRAAEAGRSVEAWWRDDDAVEAAPALDRLIGLADRSGWPLGIAAIPAAILPSLGGRIGAAALPHRVLVHGFAHANHAPAGRKKSEFGPGRGLGVALPELRQALERTLDAFGAAALPVFVAPWNRIDPDLARRLPDLGYSGLSTFGGAKPTLPGLVSCDTHLDPVDWHAGRGLVPPDALVGQLCRALASGAPRIGLLTHHLVFDAELWAFTEALVGMLARHSAVSLLAPDKVFARRERSNRRANRALIDHGISAAGMQG